MELHDSRPSYPKMAPTVTVVSKLFCLCSDRHVSSNFNVPVAEILWKFSVGGILFFVNSTAWSVLRHVRFIGTVQSIQLSVFHEVSMKCMFPLLTCSGRYS